MRSETSATASSWPAGQRRISATTTYTCLREGIAVLAAKAPHLREALEAARQAGLTHVSLDGIVVGPIG